MCGDLKLLITCGDIKVWSGQCIKSFSHHCQNQIKRAFMTGVAMEQKLKCPYTFSDMCVANDMANTMI